MNTDEQDLDGLITSRRKALTTPASSGGDLDALIAARRQAVSQPTPPVHDYHAEFKSGALGRRIANENDVEQAAVDDGQPGIAGSLADVAQGIPGVGALEAGARSIFRNQPYREAYQDITRQTDKVPTSAKIIGRTAASLPLMAMLPGSAAASGAMLGGASEALDANPDRGIAGRVGMGAVGAATGGLLGKAFEMVPTTVRAFVGGNPSSALLAKQAARAASAKQLYSQALSEGQGKAGTQAVQAFLAEPDIAGIVGELQSTRPFANTAADSPEMLDAVYKTLSDRAQTLKKGLESVTPNRPNIGRFRLTDTKAAQQQLLDALETPGTITKTTTVPPIETAQSPAPSLRDAVDNFWTRLGKVATRSEGTTDQQLARRSLERHSAENIVSPSLSGAPPGPRVVSETTSLPPVMPSYRDAVTDYATRSGDMNAFVRGNDAVKSSLSGNIPSGKALLRSTPEALGEWAASGTPSELANASEGANGAVRNALLKKPFTTGRHAVGDLPSLLRQLQDPVQARIDLLTKLGLLSANAAIR